MILCLLVKDFSARLFMAIFELPFRAPLRFVIELFESIVLLRTALSLCLSLSLSSRFKPRPTKGVAPHRRLSLRFVLRLPSSPSGISTKFCVISISISIFHRLSPSVRLSSWILGFFSFSPISPIAPLLHERERERRKSVTDRQAGMAGAWKKETVTTDDEDG